MNQTDVIAHIKDKWGKSPFVGVCLNLVNALYELDPSEGEMLTYDSVLNLLEQRELTQEIHSSLLALTSMDPPLLQAGGIYVDEDQIDHELSEADFLLVVEENFLVDPKTGLEVENPREQVMPYFALRFVKDRTA